MSHTGLLLFSAGMMTVVGGKQYSEGAGGGTVLAEKRMMQMQRLTSGSLLVCKLAARGGLVISAREPLRVLHGRCGPLVSRHFMAQTQHSTYVVTLSAMHRPRDRTLQLFIAHDVILQHGS